jgi:hypothetical protein
VTEHPVPRPPAVPEATHDVPEATHDVPEATHDVPEATVPEPPTDAIASNPWGHVTADGTVVVRTRAGERIVGSWQVDDPTAALAFFGRKFDELDTTVTLLEQRVRAKRLAPDEAAATVRRLREQLGSVAAVGALDAVADRLAAVDALVAEQRAERRAERAAAVDEARVRKEALADEAERLAAGSDWKAGADRFRVLLEEWKGLPRIDKAADDALWHRFSTARSTYTRRRKTHFAEQASRREDAARLKRAIVTEAEALAGSTEWGPTSGAFRELMTRWKAAGPAPRDLDAELWGRFKAAQDTFFAARGQANAARDEEQAANLAAKQALLVEAEAILPVKDPKAARAAYRSVLERWSAIGHVPRESIRGLDDRLSAVEQAVSGAEEARWRRTNPEARARAASTVSQLQARLATLEASIAAATERGDTARVDALTAEAEQRRSWLAEAQRVLDESAG